VQIFLIPVENRSSFWGFVVKWCGCTFVAGSVREGFFLVAQVFCNSLVEVRKAAGLLVLESIDQILSVDFTIRSRVVGHFYAVAVWAIEEAVFLPDHPAFTNEHLGDVERHGDIVGEGVARGLSGFVSHLHREVGDSPQPFHLCFARLGLLSGHSLYSTGNRRKALCSGDSP
jgi:hypothetical protein